MKPKKLVGILTKFSTILGLTALFTSHAFADNLPIFSDPAVNQFVKEYADFVGRYAEAYKATQSGDTSKLQAMQEKVQQLQSESATLATKIKPDEQEKFKQFVTEQTQKIVSTLKQ
jgi:hypothetical protein